MYTSELIQAIASWSLNVEQARSEVAATNISNANRGLKSKLVGNFSEIIDEMSGAIELKDSRAVGEIAKGEHSIKQEYAEPISLDEEVQHLSEAEKRYRVITSIYSLRSNLKSIVWSK